MDAPLLDVDDESTWPPDLRRLLDASRDLLSRAEAQRVHPKELSWEELAEDHALLVSRVQGLIDDATVVAHHCTRLHRDEIQDIQRDGLRVLSRADAAERVRRRIADGDLPPDLGERLLASTTFDDRRGQRTGRIWLVLTRGALRKEAGVWRLFTFWGGEAIYWEHIDDPVTETRLRSIGTATLVRAAVPVGLLKSAGLAEHLMRRCARRIAGEQAAFDFEDHIEQPLPGAAILRIITRSDDEFEALTGATGWEEALS